MKLHPDKLINDNNIKLQQEENKDIIYDINKFYKVLKDDLTRGYYLVR